MPTIKAVDGRTWGYARYGEAGGKPVLVHHGLIGDRNIGVIWDDLGKANGLEWIVIERPGYGQTPALAMDRIADWPTMMEPLLTVLGVTGSFAAVGISAGAPYAYALAAGMPARAGRIGILSGVPFIGADRVLAAYPADGQAAYARYAIAEGKALRAEFRAFCADMVATLAEHPHVESAVTAILAHDVAGPAREARLQAIDWGFDRSAVQCPVDLWHSDGDDMVPCAAARMSASGLPKAAWHIQAEPSHFPSEATLQEMASTLGDAELITD
ncbi:MAG: alpha/beta hydrolase [Roseitalea porphyridii]|jgi:pimeloyl-ACP methyl ester carboxylesterase|uniref:alpha/beta fold hydrolase n=1 Tax=Roseitalea porphyridii TaxID=1852022 RepID=UPI0032EF48F9